jgi:hypothetical protein
LMFSATWFWFSFLLLFMSDKFCNTLFIFHRHCVVLLHISQSILLVRLLEHRFQVQYIIKQNNHNHIFQLHNLFLESHLFNSIRSFLVISQ